MSENLRITANLGSTYRRTELCGVLVATEIKIPFKARLIRFTRFMIHFIWWIFCIPFLFVMWAKSFGVPEYFAMQILPLYGFITGFQMYFLWETIPYPRLKR